MKIIADTMAFGGQQIQFEHRSSSLDCSMQCSIYLPEQAKTRPVPVLYWLSGLTCTDQNFVTKSGAQRYAAELGIAVVCPDTSPRGDGVADDPNGDWDFGLGAGFYINATQAPWSNHYRMYDYIVTELPTVITHNFSIDPARSSISGHSMGGHGALTIALKNPDRFKSASAFSPIVSPSNCPWGIKAFSNYLGEDQSTWTDYDSCALVGVATKKLPILVDQGSNDAFLTDQLKTPLLHDAAQQADYPMTIRYQDGYDHSYHFVASFIGEHIAFHAIHLSA